MAHLKKAFTSGLLIVFVFSILAPSYGEASLWAERKAAVEKIRGDAKPLRKPPETLLAQLPSIHPGILPDLAPLLKEESTTVDRLSSLAIASQIPIANLKLPLAYSNFKSAHFPKGWKPGDLTVLHIQDVHMNPEAQTNISRSIQELMDQGKVDLVALEGAFSDIDVSGFRAFKDPEAVRMVADYFLQENKLSGAVHAALTSPKAIPPFVGVDEKALHAGHIKAYRDSAGKAEGLKKELSEEEAALEQKKAQIYNPDLLAFDRQVQSYRKGAIPLSEHVRAIFSRGGNPHSRESMPPNALIGGGNPVPSNVRTFLQALSMEESLNFENVEKERSSLIHNLSGELSKDQVAQLLNASLAYRLGKLTHTDFYRYLEELCKKSGIDCKKFPAMDQYIRYVMVSDRIHAEEFLKELQKLENEGYQALARNKVEKDVIRESRRLYLLGKLLDFALTPEEWKEWRSHSWESADRHGPLSSFESFFKHAGLRDDALTENLLARSREKKAQLAILVTGGYHSHGIAEHLDRHSRESANPAAIVTLAPKITKIEGKSGTEYLSVFTREKTPLEKLFDGDKLFVNDPVAEPHTFGSLATSMVGKLEADNPLVDTDGDDATFDALVPAQRAVRVNAEDSGEAGLATVTSQRPGGRPVSFRFRMDLISKKIIETGKPGQEAAFLSAASILRATLDLSLSLRPIVAALAFAFFLGWQSVASLAAQAVPPPAGRRGAAPAAQAQGIRIEAQGGLTKEERASLDRAKDIVIASLDPSDRNVLSRPGISVSLARLRASPKRNLPIPGILMISLGNQHIATISVSSFKEEDFIFALIYGLPSLRDAASPLEGGPVRSPTSNRFALRRSEALARSIHEDFKDPQRVRDQIRDAGKPANPSEKEDLARLTRKLEAIQRLRGNKELMAQFDGIIAELVTRASAAEKAPPPSPPPRTVKPPPQTPAPGTAKPPARGPRVRQAPPAPTPPLTVSQRLVYLLQVSLPILVPVLIIGLVQIVLRFSRYLKSRAADRRHEKELRAYEEREASKREERRQRKQTSPAPPAVQITPAPSSTSQKTVSQQAPAASTVSMETILKDLEAAETVDLSRAISYLETAEDGAREFFRREAAGLIQNRNETEFLADLENRMAALRKIEADIEARVSRTVAQWKEEGDIGMRLSERVFLALESISTELPEGGKYGEFIRKKLYEECKVQGVKDTSPARKPEAAGPVHRVFATRSALKEIGHRQKLVESKLPDFLKNPGAYKSGALTAQGIHKFRVKNGYVFVKAVGPDYVVVSYMSIQDAHRKGRSMKMQHEVEEDLSRKYGWVHELTDLKEELTEFKINGSNGGLASIFDKELREFWREGHPDQTVSERRNYRLYSVFGVWWENAVPAIFMAPALYFGLGLPVTIGMALASAFVFSGVHKGRSLKERAWLFVVGLIFAGAMAAPAFLFGHSPAALASGVVLSLFSHSFYNSLKLLDMLPSWMPMASAGDSGGQNRPVTPEIMRGNPFLFVRLGQTAFRWASRDFAVRHGEDLAPEVIHNFSEACQPAANEPVPASFFKAGVPFSRETRDRLWNGRFNRIVERHGKNIDFNALPNNQARVLFFLGVLLARGDWDGIRDLLEPGFQEIRGNLNLEQGPARRVRSPNRNDSGYQTELNVVFEMIRPELPPDATPEVIEPMFPILMAYPPSLDKIIWADGWYSVWGDALLEAIVSHELWRRLGPAFGASGNLGLVEHLTSNAYLSRQVLESFHARGLWPFTYERAWTPKETHMLANLFETMVAAIYVLNGGGARGMEKARSFVARTLPFSDEISKRVPEQVQAKGGDEQGRRREKLEFRKGKVTKRMAELKGELDKIEEDLKSKQADLHQERKRGPEALGSIQKDLDEYEGRYKDLAGKDPRDPELNQLKRIIGGLSRKKARRGQDHEHALERLASEIAAGQRSLEAIRKRMVPYQRRAAIIERSLAINQLKRKEMSLLKERSPLRASLTAQFPNIQVSREAMEILEFLYQIGMRNFQWITRPDQDILTTPLAHVRNVVNILRESGVHNLIEGLEQYPELLSRTRGRIKLAIDVLMEIQGPDAPVSAAQIGRIVNRNLMSFRSLHQALRDCGIPVQNVEELIKYHVASARYVSAKSGSTWRDLYRHYDDPDKRRQADEWMARAAVVIVLTTKFPGADQADLEKKIDAIASLGLPGGVSGALARVPGIFDLPLEGLAELKKLQFNTLEDLKPLIASVAARSKESRTLELVDPALSDFNARHAEVEKQLSAALTAAQGQDVKAAFDALEETQAAIEALRARCNEHELGQDDALDERVFEIAENLTELDQSLQDGREKAFAAAVESVVFKHDYNELANLQSDDIPTRLKTQGTMVREILDEFPSLRRSEDRVIEMLSSQGKAWALESLRRKQESLASRGRPRTATDVKTTNGKKRRRGPGDPESLTMPVTAWVWAGWLWLSSRVKLGALAFEQYVAGGRELALETGVGSIGLGGFEWFEGAIAWQDALRQAKLEARTERFRREKSPWLEVWAYPLIPLSLLLAGGSFWMVALGWSLAASLLHGYSKEERAPPLAQFASRFIASFAVTVISLSPFLLFPESNRILLSVFSTLLGIRSHAGYNAYRHLLPFSRLWAPLTMENGAGEPSRPAAPGGPRGGSSVEVGHGDLAEFRGSTEKLVGLLESVSGGSAGSGADDLSLNGADPSKTMQEALGQLRILQSKWSSYFPSSSGQTTIPKTTNNIPEMITGLILGRLIAAAMSFFGSELLNAVRRAYSGNLRILYTPAPRAQRSQGRSLLTYQFPSLPSLFGQIRTPATSNISPRKNIASLLERSKRIYASLIVPALNKRTAMLTRAEPSISRRLSLSRFHRAIHYSVSRITHRVKEGPVPMAVTALAGLIIVVLGLEFLQLPSDRMPGFQGMDGQSFAMIFGGIFGKPMGELLIPERGSGSGRPGLNPRDEAVFASARILIVDDERDIRSLILEELAEEGFKNENVSQAGSAYDALDIVESSAEKFDLIITDNRMGGPRDGMDLILRLLGEPYGFGKDQLTIWSSSRDIEEEAKSLGVSCLNKIDTLESSAFQTLALHAKKLLLRSAARGQSIEANLKALVARISALRQTFYSRIDHLNKDPDQTYCFKQIISHSLRLSDSYLRRAGETTVIHERLNSLIQADHDIDRFLKYFGFFTPGRDPRDLLKPENLNKEMIPGYDPDVAVSLKYQIESGEVSQYVPLIEEALDQARGIQRNLAAIIAQEKRREKARMIADELEPHVSVIRAEANHAIAGSAVDYDRYLSAHKEINGIIKGWHDQYPSLWGNFTHIWGSNGLFIMERGIERARQNETLSEDEIDFLNEAIRVFDASLRVLKGPKSDRLFVGQNLWELIQEERAADRGLLPPAPRGPAADQGGAHSIFSQIGDRSPFWGSWAESAWETLAYLTPMLFAIAWLGAGQSRGIVYLHALWIPLQAMIFGYAHYKADLKKGLIGRNTTRMGYFFTAAYRRHALFGALMGLAAFAAFMGLGGPDSALTRVPFHGLQIESTVIGPGGPGAPLTVTAFTRVFSSLAALKVIVPSLALPFIWHGLNNILHRLGYREILTLGKYLESATGGSGGHPERREGDVGRGSSTQASTIKLKLVKEVEYRLFTAAHFNDLVNENPSIASFFPVELSPESVINLYSLPTWDDDTEATLKRFTPFSMEDPFLLTVKSNKESPEMPVGLVLHRKYDMARRPFVIYSFWDGGGSSSPSELGGGRRDESYFIFKRVVNSHKALIARMPEPLKQPRLRKWSPPRRFGEGELELQIEWNPDKPVAIPQRVTEPPPSQTAVSKGKAAKVLYAILNLHRTLLGSSFRGDYRKFYPHEDVTPGTATLAREIKGMKAEKIRKIFQPVKRGFRSRLPSLGPLSDWKEPKYAWLFKSDLPRRFKLGTSYDGEPLDIVLDINTVEFNADDFKGLGKIASALYPDAAGEPGEFPSREPGSPSAQSMINLIAAAVLVAVSPLLPGLDASWKHYAFLTGATLFSLFAHEFGHWREVGASWQNRPRFLGWGLFTGGLGVRGARGESGMKASGTLAIWFGIIVFLVPSIASYALLCAAINLIFALSVGDIRKELALKKRMALEAALPIQERRSEIDRIAESVVEAEALFHESELKAADRAEISRVVQTFIGDRIAGFTPNSLDGRSYQPGEILTLLDDKDLWEAVQDKRRSRLGADPPSQASLFQYDREIVRSLAGRAPLKARMHGAMRGTKPYVSIPIPSNEDPLTYVRDILNEHRDAVPEGPVPTFEFQWQGFAKAGWLRRLTRRKEARKLEEKQAAIIKQIEALGHKAGVKARVEVVPQLADKQGLLNLLALNAALKRTLGAEAFTSYSMIISETSLGNLATFENWRSLDAFDKYNIQVILLNAAMQALPPMPLHHLRQFDRLAEIIARSA